MSLVIRYQERIHPVVEFQIETFRFVYNNPVLALVHALVFLYGLLFIISLVNNLIMIGIIGVAIIGFVSPALFQDNVIRLASSLLPIQ